jgi:hypothetical protein
VSLGRCYRSRGFSEEEEDRMMISRLMRGRLSSSVRALRRDVSSSHCHITGTVMNLLFSEAFEECELWMGNWSVLRIFYNWLLHVFHNVLRHLGG